MAAPDAPSVVPAGATTVTTPCNDRRAAGDRCSVVSSVRQAVSRVYWYDLIPEALLLGGLTVFAVTEPHAAVAGFKSTKALVLMAVVTVGWVAARALTFAFV